MKTQFIHTFTSIRIIINIKTSTISESSSNFLPFVSSWIPIKAARVIHEIAYNTDTKAIDVAKNLVEADNTLHTIIPITIKIANALHTKGYSSNLISSEYSISSLSSYNKHLELS